MSRKAEIAMVQAYSDIALKGAIAGLERMRFLDKWGEQRIKDLKAEQQRRAAKRREDGKVVEHG